MTQAGDEKSGGGGGSGCAMRGGVLVRGEDMESWGVSCTDGGGVDEGFQRRPSGWHSVCLIIMLKTFIFFLTPN